MTFFKKAEQKQNTNTNMQNPILFLWESFLDVFSVALRACPILSPCRPYCPPCCTWPICESCCRAVVHSSPCRGRCQSLGPSQCCRWCECSRSHSAAPSPPCPAPRSRTSSWCFLPPAGASGRLPCAHTGTSHWRGSEPSSPPAGSPAARSSASYTAWETGPQTSQPPAANLTAGQNQILYSTLFIVL